MPTHHDLSACHQGDGDAQSHRPAYPRAFLRERPRRFVYLGVAKASRIHNNQQCDAKPPPREGKP